MKKKSYYRRITEGLPKTPEFSPHLLSFIASFLVVLSFVLLTCLVIFYLKASSVYEEKRKAYDSLLYWEAVLKKNPNFPDAYYNAAIYSVKLSENKKAGEYLDRAIELDPTFKNAVGLRKKISR